MHIYDSNNNYDTSKSVVKTYISFQPLQTGANTDAISLPDTALLSQYKVVTIDGDWQTEKSARQSHNLTQFAIFS